MRMWRASNWTIVHLEAGERRGRCLWLLLWIEIMGVWKQRGLR